MGILILSSLRIPLLVSASFAELKVALTRKPKGEQGLHHGMGTQDE
jgi:hypothetical protein